MVDDMEASPPTAEPEAAGSRPDPTLPGGYGTFFAALALLAAVRIAIGFVSLPLAAIGPTNLLLAALFVAVPVLAEFFGANSWWNWKIALLFIVAGVACQVGFGLFATTSSGAMSGVANAVAQMGLDTWCVGLGALLGASLRDKNLLIPISIFGAAYDYYLVIAPAGLPGAGLTRNIINTAPKVFNSVAAQVPTVTSHAATGKAAVGSFVGPADLVFLAAFFVVVFKFKMNARLTVSIVAPVLVLYMLAVLLLGIALPALVPIGACVVIANWRHFDLKRDEWLTTLGLAVFCAAFILWGMAKQRQRGQEQQAEPSRQAGGQAPARSGSTPAPTGQASRPSGLRSAPGSTQGPP